MCYVKIRHRALINHLSNCPRFNVTLKTESHLLYKEFYICIEFKGVYFNESLFFYPRINSVVTKLFKLLRLNEGLNRNCNEV